MPKIPSLRADNPLHFFATGFGAGFAPWAPGTFGSLMGWGTFVIVNPLISPLGWAILIPLFWVLGAAACQGVAKEIGQQDPPQLAIDEVVAMWLVLSLLPQTNPGWAGQLMGFALFRLFDIIKRGPVGWVDHNIHGGVGIMLDDIVAAVLAVLAGAGLIWVKMQV